MGDARLQQKTPAEFFAENRNIAGFDNDGKCLYTTVREFVENSLDAAETIGKLPEVSITMCALTLRAWRMRSGVHAPACAAPRGKRLALRESSADCAVACATLLAQRGGVRGALRHDAGP